DREVLDRPLRLGPPFRGGRHPHLTHRVVLDPVLLAHAAQSPRLPPRPSRTIHPRVHPARRLMCHPDKPRGWLKLITTRHCGTVVLPCWLGRMLLEDKMAVEKISVSLDEVLIARARQEAEESGLSLSGWLAKGAARLIEEADAKHA